MIFIKSVKFILKFLLFITFITILYFLTAYLLVFLPTTKEEKEQKRDEDIYILYDTMHSDILLNIKSLNNKKLTIQLRTFINKREGYLAFGWGDKETYLNTPTWNDIKISTSLKALFINTHSLMHVSYISNIKKYKNIKKLKISKEQLAVLEKSILKSFNLELSTYYQGYGRDDFFYPSVYKYNLFNTCNTWTGDRLREANVSMSYWTPLSSNIIDSLP
jgi:uncharacterized protein (TIGR02117 family)